MTRGEKMTAKDIADACRSGDIKCHVIAMPPKLWGFVFQTRRAKIHIFVSEDLSPMARFKVFLHECYHALEHIEGCYFIGIDMQHCPIEQEAESAAADLFSQYVQKDPQ